MSAQWVPVLNLLVDVMLIFAVAFLMSLRGSPRLRVLLLRCAFAVSLLAPLLVLSIAPKGLIEIPVSSETSTVSLTAPFKAPIPHNGTLRNRAAVQHFAVASEGQGSARMLLTIWLLGALLVLGRYLVSIRFLSHAYANGAAVPAAMEARVGHLRAQFPFAAGMPVRITPDIGSPCTFGWLKPKVLLPREFSEVDFVDAILAHEFCHVRNRDALWLMIGQFAVALFWFNPFVWLCARAHCDMIELVCDDDAAEITADVDGYVSGLIGAARRLTPASSAAGAMMTTRGLSARIHLLLERTHPMQQLSHWARNMIYTAGALTVGLIATTGIVSAQPDDAPPPLKAIDVMSDQAHRPGEGVLFLRAEGVDAGSRRLGFSCSDGSCRFTFPSDAPLRISTRSDARLKWTGCEPSDDTQSCTVRFTNGIAHVKVTRID